MIVSPRKSVTRFFIPLIDVLILLFCIFLLMPFVSGGPDAPEPAEKPPEKKLPEDVKVLQARVTELEAQLKEEQRRVGEMERRLTSRVTDRLMVRVLEIDPTDGTLYYFDPDRRDIRTQADAVSLITRQKALASRDGVVKDVFFLVLYPRKVTGFPRDDQIRQIKEWFKDVPLGFDKQE